MRRIALALLLLAWPSAAGAAPPPDPAETTDCAAAIATAQRSADIPAGLLAAIAHVESGRPDPVGGAVQPWPWTINVGGAGRFFATKTEAIAATAALREHGVASVDVGCLQVNLAYHPKAFASLEEAFDPLANALYAARFLRLLFSQTGDWPTTVAAYHSQTREIGAAYQGKVLAVWTSPGLIPSPPVDSHPPALGPANWAGGDPRDKKPWAAAFDGKSPHRPPITPSAPPWIERVIAAVAGCAMPAATPSPLRGATAEIAAAWKGSVGNCPVSPFSKSAALRHLLSGP